MTNEELFNQVEAHEELEGVGFLDTDKGPAVVIKHTPTRFTTQIPVSMLSALDWPVLESVLTGKRDPIVLQHMTRVCGYFSHIQNWNQSKIGELRDRHKGNYAVQEAGV